MIFFTELVAEKDPVPTTKVVKDITSTADVGKASAPSAATDKDPASEKEEGELSDSVLSEVVTISSDSVAMQVDSSQESTVAPSEGVTETSDVSTVVREEVATPEEGTSLQLTSISTEDLFPVAAEHSADNGTEAEADEPVEKECEDAEMESAQSLPFQFKTIVIEPILIDEEEAVTEAPVDSATRTDDVSGAAESVSKESEAEGETLPVAAGGQTEVQENAAT